MQHHQQHQCQQPLASVCLLSLICLHVFFVNAVSSCSHGALVRSPQNQHVSIGHGAEFECVGYGASVQWFINGININEMTDGEKLANGGLDIEDSTISYCSRLSYLRVNGSCANNNSKIYCALYGNNAAEGNTTSNTAILTVAEGYPITVESIKAIPRIENSVSITWQLQQQAFSWSQDLRISLSIEDLQSHHNIFRTELGSNETSYLYTPTNSDLITPCTLYKITVGITDTLRGCSNFGSLVQRFKESPSETKIVHVQTFGTKIQFIQFEINYQYSCGASTPTAVEVLLLSQTDNNTAVITSGKIAWDNVITLASLAKLYQINWNHSRLRDNDNYRMILISHYTGGISAYSESYKLSTFDVQRFEYKLQRDTSFCMTCTFSDATESQGCLVSLLNTNTLQTEPPVKIRRVETINTATICTSLVQSGRYSIMAYDWEQNGEIFFTDPAATTHTEWINIPDSLQSDFSQENNSHTPSTNETCHGQTSPTNLNGNLPIYLGVAIASLFLLVLTSIMLMTMKTLLSRKSNSKDEEKAIKCADESNKHTKQQITNPLYETMSKTTGQYTA